MQLRASSIGLLLLGLTVILGPSLRAQTPPEPQSPTQQSAAQQPDQPEAPIHTLHVYMDLIQVPVLVLDTDLSRMRPIDPSKFLVSLDAGPTFRPRHVRQEADDPITLAILLDVNGASEVMPHISAALAALAPGSLHAHDHVTVYGLDCKLLRTLNDVPADSEQIKTAADEAIASWTANHKLKHPPPCEKRVQLWDSMGYAIDELGKLPGRRILLAVTDGVDHGSVSKWDNLRSFAQEEGVAVFGYAPRTEGPGRLPTSSPGSGRGGRGATSLPITMDINAPDDPFSTICQSSGGMIMPADPGSVSKQLAKFATLVRERYILEFSRARNDTPGVHGIVISVVKMPNAYVRPAGVSYMGRDEALDNDPSVIPRDTTDAPEIGKSKPARSPNPK